MKLKSVSIALLFLFLLMLSFPYAISVKNFENNQIEILCEDSNLIIIPDDYLTVSEGIENAESGDVIFVKNGRYYDITHIGFNEEAVFNRILGLEGEK